MTRALAVVVTGGTDNWSPARWRDRFAMRLPDRPVVLLPDGAADLAAITYAAVWKPPAGLLARLPNLRVVFNLGAGVDGVLADPTLPNVPLVRAVSPDLTGRMTEYVVMQVLLHHRRWFHLMACQRERRWAPGLQWAARDLRVGVLGLGVLGRDSAQVLARLGFQVAGWSRAPQRVEGIACFAGRDQLDSFLARTDILVCLLPLTADTRGLVDRALLKKLARNGPLGGPILINAGRGGLHVEADVIAALDDGTLAGASLDVFEIEPLPLRSPLWAHPKVIVTPHNAADSDADVLAADVADQITAFERGAALANVVDRAIGY